MATKVYLKQRLNSGSSLTSYGYASPNPSVVALTTSVTNTTAAGTKIQATATGGGTAVKWISPPVAAAFTCSGTVTFNVWAKLAAAANNATVRVELVKYSGGAEGSVFASATFGAPTALTTTMAVNNWTVTPSSTAFAAGDRIVAYIYIVNVGTMGAGTPGVTVDYSGPTAAVDGDTWFQLNEAVTWYKEAEYIQDTSNSGSSVTFAGKTTAGNAIVGWIVWDTASATISSVTDGGDTFALIGSPQVWNTTRSFQAFYANNVAGGGPPTVTVNFTGTPTGNFTRIAEYGGVHASAFDVGGGYASGSGTAAASGNITTTFANEIIIGLMNELNSTGVTGGTGYIVRSSGSGHAVEDKSVTAKGTYSAAMTLVSDQWAMGIIALKWGTQVSKCSMIFSM